MAAQTTQEPLARRIARSLIEELDLNLHDVWYAVYDPEAPGYFDRRHPQFEEEVMVAVIERVAKMRPANRGILVDRATYTQLPFDYFMADTSRCGAPGRNFLRDAATAAILSELLELL